MNNTLTLEEISRMSLEDIKYAYSKGYVLSGRDKRLITYLQTVCPVGTLNIGDNVGMTLVGLGGTPLYTMMFQKNGITLPNGVFTGVGEGIPKTYVYKINSADISPLSLIGNITDSCDIPQSCSRYCDITISGASPTPPTTTIPPCGTLSCVFSANVML